MKNFLFATFALLLGFPASAQTPPLVQFNLMQITGQANNRAITLTPHDDQNGTIYQSNFVSDIPITLKPVAGFAQTNLLPNIYDVQIEGINRTWQLLLTNTSGTFNAYTLLTNYAAATFPVPPLVAGTGISLSTGIVSGVTQITINNTGTAGSQTPLVTGVDGAQNSISNLSGISAKFATNATLTVSNTLTASNITATAITSSNGFIGAATTATNVTGAFTGDVTGTQGATVVATVGTSTAFLVHGAEVLVHLATASSTASTLVMRTAFGTITSDLSSNHVSGMVFVPTNTFDPTWTVSGTSGTFILTLTGATTLTAGANNLPLHRGDSFQTTSDFAQYWVDGFVSGDNTKIRIAPQLVNTYSTQATSDFSPNCVTTTDDTGNANGNIGGDSSFGVVTPVEGNSGGYWMYALTNTVFQTMRIDEFGYARVEYDTYSFLNQGPPFSFSTHANGNSLRVLPNSVTDVEHGLTNVQGNLSLLGTVQIPALNTANDVLQVNGSGVLSQTAAPTIGGANITGIVAAGLPTDVAYKDLWNLFTASNTFTGAIDDRGSFTNAGGTRLNGSNTLAGANVISNLSATSIIASSFVNVAGGLNSSGSFSSQGIMLMDSGLFTTDAAGNITAVSFTGSGSGLTGIPQSGITSLTTALAAKLTGTASIASGDLTGTYAAPSVATVGGLSSSTIATGVGAANAATSANTASKLVARDGSGNFSAGTITASFSGNGAALTGLLATSHAWTNYNVPTANSGTNFIINASAAQNASCLVSNDFVIVGFTNGPGNSVSLHLLDLGTTNHNFMFPTAWQLYGMTNLVSTTKGTNSLVILTNTIWLNAVIGSLDGTANPVATNTGIWIGLPH